MFSLCFLSILSILSIPVPVSSLFTIPQWTVEPVTRRLRLSATFSLPRVSVVGNPTPAPITPPGLIGDAKDQGEVEGGAREATVDEEVRDVLSGLIEKVAVAGNDERQKGKDAAAAAADTPGAAAATGAGAGGNTEPAQDGGAVTVGGGGAEEAKKQITEVGGGGINAAAAGSEGGEDQKNGGVGDESYAAVFGSRRPLPRTPRG